MGNKRVTDNPPEFYLEKKKDALVAQNAKVKSVSSQISVLETARERYIAEAVEKQIVINEIEELVDEANAIKPELIELREYVNSVLDNPVKDAEGIKTIYPKGFDEKLERIGVIEERLDFIPQQVRKIFYNKAEK